MCPTVGTGLLTVPLWVVLMVAIGELQTNWRFDDQITCYQYLEFYCNDLVGCNIMSKLSVGAERSRYCETQKLGDNMSVLIVVYKKILVLRSRGSITLESPGISSCS